MANPTGEPQYDQHITHAERHQTTLGQPLKSLIRASLIILFFITAFYFMVAMHVLGKFGPHPSWEITISWVIVFISPVLAIFCLALHRYVGKAWDTLSIR